MENHKTLKCEVFRLPKCIALASDSTIEIGDWYVETYKPPYSIGRRTLEQTINPNIIEWYKRLEAYSSSLVTYDDMPVLSGYWANKLAEATYISTVELEMYDSQALNIRNGNEVIILNAQVVTNENAACFQVDHVADIRNKLGPVNNLIAICQEIDMQPELIMIVIHEAFKAEEQMAYILKKLELLRPNSGQFNEQDMLRAYNFIPDSKCDENSPEFIRLLLKIQNEKLEAQNG